MYSMGKNTLGIQVIYNVTALNIKLVNQVDMLLSGSMSFQGNEDSVLKLTSRAQGIACYWSSANKWATTTLYRLHAIKVNKCEHSLIV